MKILVLNAGSSSLKYQLLETKDQSIIAKGTVEKIGLGDTFIGFSNTGHAKVERTFKGDNHEIALQEVFDSLTKGKEAVLKSLDEIQAIGHRVVHGGEKYAKSSLINADLISTVQTLSEIAPLHNPPNLMGIKACQKILPKVPQVAVFDTAFHQTMPEVAYMYGLPYDYYKKYGIRRYGFHGTSFAYVTQKTAEFLGKKPEDTNLIICHIGNGASIAAVKNGKSVDTTMGFTPLEGLIMGTRAGTFDTAALLYLMEKEKLSIADASDLVNKKSGLLGVSGVSSDMRDVEKAAAEGNHRAELAKEMLAYRIRKTIGAFSAVLEGKIDAVCFTAGMGEFDTGLRLDSCKGLEYLGISIDEAVNSETRSKLQEISKKGSKIKVLCVPTNEELMIALETEKLAK